MHQAAWQLAQHLQQALEVMLRGRRIHRYGSMRGETLGVRVGEAPPLRARSHGLRAPAASHRSFKMRWSLWMRRRCGLHVGEL